MSVFLLYGQRFPRYRLIFKIAIFGHETSKVPEVAHVHSFDPKGSKLSLILLYGVEIELIFALRAAVSEIPRFSKLPYLGMKLGH